MKHLILDHMRRWGWVLALAGLFEAFVGWGVQRHPDGNFEFWCLLTSLWAGANLLQQDFPRGIVRAVSIMPVTSRQVGQGWWLATVLIPAVILTALLGLGAGIYQFIHPGHALQFDRLELAAAFTSIWLGIVGCGVFSTLSFRVSSGIATAGGLAGPWWNLKSTGLVGLLSTVFILGGMVYFQDASKVPFKMVLFLGLGMVLTLLGWFRAATFDFAPVVMKGVAPLQRPGGFPALHRAPSGFGGLPFLLATTFLKTFLVSLLMARIMYIMMTLQGHVKDIGTFMVPMAMFVPMWLILVLLMPFLSHIRYLRTLPISSHRLAATLIGMNLLPFIAFCGVIAMFVAAALGGSSATAIVTCLAVNLVPCALAACIGLWFGVGRLAWTIVSFLMMATLIGCQVVWHGKILPMIGLPIVLAGIVGAFLFAYWLLTNNSRVYRNHGSQASPFDGTIVSWWR